MHPACVRKFFGTETLPVLDYTTAQLDQLALKIIQEQTSLTGVQPKLSLHLNEHEDCKRLTIVVGRDARISGEMVNDLVEGTLLGCGADVINIGLCTTPGTELAVIANHADGGIIITASHNPKQWNALKLLNEHGEFLNDAEGKQVLALAESSDFAFPEVDAIGRVLSRE